MRELHHILPVATLQWQQNIAPHFNSRLLRSLQQALQQGPYHKAKPQLSQKAASSAMTDDA